MLLEHTNISGTHRMLIDCGTTAQKALFDAGVDLSSVDDVYISHQHSDHCGGLEWLGFSRYFGLNTKRPRLLVNESLFNSLWNDTLRGGMEHINGKHHRLNDYFDVKELKYDWFKWHDSRLMQVPLVHMQSPQKTVYSFGLWINTVFISTDCKFDNESLHECHKTASLIFQDCETYDWRGSNKSGVHAHYNELKTLPDEIKKKMWLYHYQDGEKPNAEEDGFAGFVYKGQSFEI